MLESDWLTNVLRCVIIFRETHGECSSRQLSFFFFFFFFLLYLLNAGSFLDRITWPYHFAKWFLLFQRSNNRKITKTHNDTGQTNKYSKQKDKIDRSCPCVCHEITFYYVWKAHSLLSLSRSRSLPHRHTYSLHTPQHKRFDFISNIV